MDAGAFRFVFEPQVSLAEAEMSVHLAMFAVEGLVGRVRVRLDGHYHVDEPGHAIVIDASRDVGQMISRVFTGLLLREFGEGAFHIRRVDRLPDRSKQERTVPARTEGRVA